MSIISRGRSFAAGLVAALAGKNPNVVIVDEAHPVTEPAAPKEEVIVTTPVAKAQRHKVATSRGRPKYTNARYHGGKHRAGASVEVMQQYVDEAQAKHERKNKKRYLDHCWAVVNNPCIKAA